MTQTSRWDLRLLLPHISWAGGGFSSPSMVGGSSRRPQDGGRTNCAPDGLRAGMHQAGPGWAGEPERDFPPFTRNKNNTST